MALDIDAAHPGDYAFEVAKHMGVNFRKGRAPFRLIYIRDMIIDGELPPLHVACLFGTAAEALPLIAASTAAELWRTVTVRGKHDEPFGIKFAENIYTAGRCARERLGMCSDARVYRVVGGRDPYSGDQDRVSEALVICDALKKRAVDLGAPWGDLTTFDLTLLDCAPRIDSEMGVLDSEMGILDSEMRVLMSQTPQLQARERRPSLIAMEELFMNR